MAEFEVFVKTAHGQETWREVCSRAGLPGRIFTAISVYPDEEIVALVEAAVELTGKPAGELLGLFGEHLVAPLISVYGNLLASSWQALDLLENVETTIHRVVRLKDPTATPPKLRCERISDREVVITYQSPRGLCALAQGLSRGIAMHFGERIEITESQCRHSGADACLIVARKLD